MINLSPNNTQRDLPQHQTSKLMQTQKSTPKIIPTISKGNASGLESIQLRKLDPDIPLLSVPRAPTST